MINFVVCSLEDVLLKEGNGRVLEETIDLISNLKENDVTFAVATALNYDAVKELFGKVKNDIIYICNDGGSIVYQDNVIQKTPIDRLICIDVASEFEEDRRFRLLYSGEKGAYITTRDYNFKNRLKSMGVFPEEVKDTREMHGDITKITIFAKNGLDGEMYEHFYKKWYEKANVSATNEEQAFITAKNVSKGNAIAQVQQGFGISPEDTVVFGSGFSDIDMFGHSYYSYAMQWADAQVRGLAKHIAENVNTILEDILRI